MKRKGKATEPAEEKVVVAEDAMTPPPPKVAAAETGTSDNPIIKSSQIGTFHQLRAYDFHELWQRGGVPKLHSPEGHPISGCLEHGRHAYRVVLETQSNRGIKGVQYRLVGRQAWVQFVVYSERVER